MFESIGVS